MVLQVAPQPFYRIEFWNVGRQKQGHNMGRQLHGFGVVKGAIIQPDDIARIRTGFTTAVPPEREGMAVEGRQFQKEALAGGRSHGPIDVEPREDMLDGAHWLDASGGEASSPHG